MQNNTSAGGIKSAARWLVAPAVGDSPRSHAIAAAALRILVGLLWLYNVAWKRPPHFGENSGKGIYGYTKDAVEHPVFKPFSWLVENVILPNFTVFGWGVLIVETALAVLLLTGAYVRLAALIGIAQALAIGLSVAETPGEWPWSYWLMIGLHVVLLFGVAGSVLAVDRLRAERTHAARAGSTMLIVWGVIVSLDALVVLIRSIGGDALGKGAQFGGSDLSISLGTYNLVGSIVLLVTGLGLLAATRFSAVVTGRAVAVLALLAAITLYVQLPFTDPWLGGSNTSAAFFLAIAVVGAFVPRSLDQSLERSRDQVDDPRSADASTPRR